MVLAAAGAVDHDALVKLAAGAFGSVPDEDKTVKQLVAAVGGRLVFGGGEGQGCRVWSLSWVWVCAHSRVCVCE
jgi:hypothetical protein